MNASAVQKLEDTRRATNPIFNDNKLKLGLFGYNATSSPFSAAPERYHPTWANSLDLAGKADKIGLEAMLAYSGWRGPIAGDANHMSNEEFDTATWCAAVGAVTKVPGLIYTFHSQLTYPASVAKAAATIDAVTNGRVILNIVAGSNRLGFGQFGLDIEDPVTRYEHAAEFMEVLRRFWLEDDEFDFEGRFYKVKAGVSRPRPIQKPFPAIVNAGVSERGKEFVAKYADVAFTHFKDDPETWVPHVRSYHELANKEYGRQVQVWTHGYVVIADTEKEAANYLDYYAEKNGDHRWVNAWINSLSENQTQLRPEQTVHMTRRWAAGGGVRIVGTPDSVTDQLIAYSKAGVDGILLTALEPSKMLDQLAADVMPRLEQAGLRRPARR
jgi:alkanesulfonate monooxygenase SsuD/methylene tetrahydromethanopterin reductase-like flavin-dependent oxidoreductase (luciferase family)